MSNPRHAPLAAELSGFPVACHFKLFRKGFGALDQRGYVPLVPTIQHVTNDSSANSRTQEPCTDGDGYTIWLINDVY